LAILSVSQFGIFGILIASVVAHLGVTTAMSAKAASTVIGSWRQQSSGYLISIVLLLAASGVAWLGQQLQTSPVAMLAITALAVMISMAVTAAAVPVLKARTQPRFFEHRSLKAYG
jgi:apolipoprotein N-acyltransferase